MRGRDGGRGSEGGRKSGCLAICEEEDGEEEEQEGEDGGGKKIGMQSHLQLRAEWRGEDADTLRRGRVKLILQENTCL